MLAKSRALIIYLLLSFVSSLSAAVVDLDNDKAVWILNSNENSIQALVDLGLTDEDYQQWLQPDVQVVLLGNVFTTGSELTTQLSQFLQLQALASQNNSQLVLLRGQAEHQLLESDQFMNITSPMVVRWRTHLIANKGISLKAQENAFDNSSEEVTWSGDIHYPMNYLGSQICHPYVETNRLRLALDNLSVDTLWVARAEVLPDHDWQRRLKNQLNVLNTGLVVKLSTSDDIEVTKSGASVTPAQAPDRYPANPVGIADARILEILSQGVVVDSQEIPIGITKPLRLTLEFEGERVDAIFKSLDNSPNLQRGTWKIKNTLPDRFGYEIAAYKLDRILNLGLVPVAVEREINGKRGSLQIWYDGLISKLGYRRQEIEYGGHCDRRAQREMMHVFDYLIRNEDRNQSNMLYNESDWQVWFIDHSRAFGVQTKRHKSQRKSNFKVTPEFMAALDSFEREELQVLRKWLHKHQVFAIHKRRRNLVRGKY